MLDSLDHSRRPAARARRAPAAGAWLWLAGLVLLPVSVALFSSPRLAREARAYDRARRLGLASQDGSGWREEPAVVLEEGLGGDRKTWKLRLGLQSGDSAAVMISRGNLRGFVGPGSAVRAQFWRGKVTEIQSGDRRAETYDNPDWRIDNNRVGAVMCWLLLGLFALLPRPRGRLRVRVRFGR